jgi:hypothetical protein
MVPHPAATSGNTPNFRDNSGMLSGSASTSDGRTTYRDRSAALSGIASTNGINGG